MLNLLIVMFQLLLTIFLALFAQTANLSISSPQSGQVLRGKVEITGNLGIPNFSSAELAFGYAPEGGASSPADLSAWFTIQTFSQPIKNAALAVWDTTQITDGDYTLRLRVFLQDGTSQDVFVSNLKILNDVPLPTNTPTATIVPTTTNPPPVRNEQTVVPTITYPSPTPLPSNPASVTTTSIYSTFARGGLLVLGLFFVFGVFLRFRNRT